MVVVEEKLNASFIVSNVDIKADFAESAVSDFCCRMIGTEFHKDLF